MPRSTHILCLLLLAFTAYAQPSNGMSDSCTWVGNVFESNGTYSCDINNCTASNGTNYTNSQCYYIGGNYSADCTYNYSQLSDYGYGLSNCDYYTCPLSTNPESDCGPLNDDGSSSDVSNCTFIGTVGGYNYSCLQYNCSMTNGTSYRRSKCSTGSYFGASCTYNKSSTTNNTCNIFSYNYNCFYNSTTITEDNSYSCDSYNCAYDNGTQFGDSSCQYIGSGNDGCSYYNTTSYSSTYQCNIYYCSFSNGTEYYKDDDCYYFGSNYSQDCTYIMTQAQVDYSIVPMTEVCNLYNCMNNDTNITTNQNCSQASAINFNNCSYINTTSETQSFNSTNVVFTCNNYQCAINGVSYVHPSCTLTDPQCTTSTTMNETYTCQNYDCLFSNGTRVANQDCLPISCIALNSTNNDTFTCTTYNCTFMGFSTVTTNCEINAPSDQNACTYLNTTTNSTYTCNYYNCTFLNNTYVSADCSAIGVPGNNGNTGNTGNTGNNQGTGTSPSDTSGTNQDSNTSSSNSTWAIVVGSVLGVSLISAGVFVWYKFRMAKKAAHLSGGLSTELGTGLSSNSATQLRVAH